MWWKTWSPGEGRADDALPEALPGVHQVIGIGGQQIASAVPRFSFSTNSNISLIYMRNRILGLVVEKCATGGYVAEGIFLGQYVHGYGQTRMEAISSAISQYQIWGGVA